MNGVVFVGGGRCGQCGKKLAADPCYTLIRQICEAERSTT